MFHKNLQCAAFAGAVCLLCAGQSSAGFIEVNAGAGTSEAGYVSFQSDSGLGASASAVYDSDPGLDFVIHAESLATSGTNGVGLSTFRLRAISDYSGPDSLIESRARADLTISDELEALLPDVGTTVFGVVRIQVDGILVSSNTDNLGQFNIIGNYGTPDEVYGGNETPGGAGPYSQVFEVPITFTGAGGIYAADFSLFAYAEAFARETERVEVDFSNTLTILGIDYQDGNGNALRGTTQSDLGLNFNGPQVSAVPAPGGLVLLATALPGLICFRRRAARRSRPTAA